MRPGVAGLVLAAEADAVERPSSPPIPRMLVADEAGTTLLAQAIRSLTDAGCDPVLVVVGAHDERVRAELLAIVDRGVGADLRLVECPTWRRGPGEVLRTGLEALPGVVEAHRGSDVDGVVITLADLPEQGPEAVRRLLAADPRREGALARTTRAGRPDHPVLIGRDRWATAARAHEDLAARELLRSPGTVLVDIPDPG